MGNLKTKSAILIKGGLFLGVGLAASGLLVLRHTDVVTTILLALSIWSFCRFYYFAFYVIELYVDSHFRFTGLIDFVRYFLTGRCVDQSEL